MSELKYLTTPERDLAKEALDSAKEAETQHSSFVNVFHGSDNVSPLDAMIRVRVFDHSGATGAEGDGNDATVNREVELEVPVDFAALRDHRIQVCEVTIGDIEINFSVKQLPHVPESTFGEVAS